mgnify:CR=1 FL=1
MIALLIKSAIICIPYTTPQYHAHKPITDSFITCVSIAVVSDLHGVDPIMATSAKSHAGAVGTLQILPKYHCPNKTIRGCNLLYSGIHALIKYMRKYGKWGGSRGGKVNWDEALCHYNSGGKCYDRSIAYATKIQARAKRIRRQLTRKYGLIFDFRGRYKKSSWYTR